MVDKVVLCDGASVSIGRTIRKLKVGRLFKVYAAVWCHRPKCCCSWTFPGVVASATLCLPPRNQARFFLVFPDGVLRMPLDEVQVCMLNEPIVTGARESILDRVDKRDRLR